MQGTPELLSNYRRTNRRCSSLKLPKHLLAQYTSGPQPGGSFPRKTDTIKNSQTKTLLLRKKKKKKIIFKSSPISSKLLPPIIFFQKKMWFYIKTKLDSACHLVHIEGGCVEAVVVVVAV